MEEGTGGGGVSKMRQKMQMRRRIYFNFGNSRVAVERGMGEEYVGCRVSMGLTLYNEEGYVICERLLTRN